MASTSRKRSAILCDDEVKECLLGSKCEESLLDSEFDSENELDDCALLDGVVDDNSDEDDDIQDCRGGHEQLQGAKVKFHG
jgi:hypothetical protein